MELNLAIAAFALMAVGNYWIARSVLYPPFIFSFMFLLELGIFRAGLVEMDPLHTNTLVFVSCGALLFSLGGLVSRIIPEQFVAMRFDLTALPLRSRVPKYALLALLLFSFPLIVHDRVEKAAQGSGNSFIERARNATIDQATEGRRSSDYVVNSIPPIAITATLLFMLEEYDWAFWTCTGLTLVISLSGGGRTDVLQLITAMTGIRLIRTNRESFSKAVKFVKWPALIFVAFFVAFVYVSKDTSSYDGLGGVISFFLVGYLISPTAALDRVFQHPGDFLVSNHTLQILLKPASALGLISYTPPPVLDQFIFVPMPTNVYTVYRFYLTDFGVIGALCCMAIIGAVHSILYRRATSRDSRLSLVLYGFSLFAVVMAIFDDHYFELVAYLRIIVMCTAYWSLSSMNLRWLPLKKTASASAG